MKKLYRYISGEQILVGDKIKLNGVPGKIIAIFEPGSNESVSWGCEAGGVLANIPDSLGLVFITDPEKDEDLEKEKL